MIRIALVLSVLVRYLMVVFSMYMRQGVRLTWSKKMLGASETAGKDLAPSRDLDGHLRFK